MIEKMPFSNPVSVSAFFDSGTNCGTKSTRCIHLPFLCGRHLFEFFTFPLPLVSPPFFFFSLSSVFFHIWCMTDTAVSSYGPSIQKRITKQTLVGIMVVHVFEGTGAGHLEEAVSHWGLAVWNSDLFSRCLVLPTYSDIYPVHSVSLYFSA